MTTCPSCLTLLDVSHRFCPQCGTDVSGPIARPGSSTRRHRIRRGALLCFWVSAALVLAAVLWSLKDRTVLDDYTRPMTAGERAAADSLARATSGGSTPSPAAQISSPEAESKRNAARSKTATARARARFSRARTGNPPAGHRNARDAGQIDLDGNGTLAFNGVDPMPVAITEAGLKDFDSARRAHDRARMKYLLLHGAIFTVPNGTQVRRVGGGIRRMKISIREGAHAGEQGWVHADWVGAPR